jgi:pyroglutamyl-peptidase
MPLTVLLTGFGPFPGAPYNPTATLVAMLARHHSQPGVRRIAHVFATSYEEVDRDLPALIARTCPDIVLMFGLAQRARHVRIETCARNVLSRAQADVAGRLPTNDAIAPGGPDLLPMRVPAGRLVAAARSAGFAAALSRDAGSYLCNYLCWRASEASGPRLVSFVHVPLVRRSPNVASLQRCRRPVTLGDLALAGEVIVRTAIASLRH